MPSKAILLSIRPQYVSLIESGQKTYELRRKRPKIQDGDLALIYESSPTKSMVGAFIVGDVISMEPGKLWREIGKLSGVTKTQFEEYFEGCNEACAIEIQRYWPFSQRVGLRQMRSKVKIEPPQSYRYLCEAQTGMLVGNGT